MEMLVVGSKVKNYIKEKGCHTSSELLEGLSEEVAKMLSNEKVTMVAMQAARELLKS